MHLAGVVETTTACQEQSNCFAESVAKPAIEDSDYVIKYGYEWPKARANDLSVELACYAEPKKFVTGHPPEYHFKKAFECLWPKFRWNKWMELMAWAWCNYRIVSVMGHARAGKTFICAHFAVLDYLASPKTTATTMTTTQFGALKTRMWSDLLRAVETCAQAEVVARLFKVTSSSNEMKFALKGSPADGKFMIQGVAVDKGDVNAGKLRGQHTDRRRIIVDEAQDVSVGIYGAFTNAMSAPDFKGWLLTNPVEKISDYGDWSRPKNGWSSITEADEWWETERGVCLRLDGLKSPNFLAGKNIYPQMMTIEYVDLMRRTEGEGSVKWWMFVRGFFPPDGTVARIWSSASVEKARQDVQFDFAPISFGTLDPAFGGDDCVLILGKLGKLRNGRYCANAKTSDKIVTDESLPVEKDYQIAREVMRRCKEYGVAPEDFIMDETGNARGVLAILRTEWSPKVQGVSYQGKATDRPLRLNDSKPAEELVKYFVSELWFRASYLAQEGMLCGLNNLHQNTTTDLSARRFEMKEKLMVAESKDEFKGRLGRSPDYGDSFSQIGELMVRKGMLGEITQGGTRAGWTQARKRALKANARWSEEKEFTHGAS